MKKYLPFAAIAVVAIAIGAKYAASIKPRLVTLPVVGKFFA